MNNMTKKEVSEKLFTLVRSAMSKETLDSVPIRKKLFTFNSSQSQLAVMKDIINEAHNQGISGNDLKKLKALVTKIEDVQFYSQVR